MDKHVCARSLHRAQCGRNFIGQHWIQKCYDVHRTASHASGKCIEIRFKSPFHVVIYHKLPFIHFGLISHIAINKSNKKKQIFENLEIIYTKKIGSLGSISFELIIYFDQQKIC